MVGVAVLKKVTLEDQKRKPDQNISKHNSWKRAANREHRIGKYSPGQRSKYYQHDKMEKKRTGEELKSKDNISCGDAHRKINSALDKGIIPSWGTTSLLKVGNFKQ